MKQEIFKDSLTNQESSQFNSGPDYKDYVHPLLSFITISKKWGFSINQYPN